MTPRDHAERRKRIPTTAFAIILILPHIVLRSHWPCRTIRFIAATDRFASMSFAPFYFVPDFMNREQLFAALGRSPDWRPGLTSSANQAESEPDHKPSPCVIHPS